MNDPSRNPEWELTPMSIAADVGKASEHCLPCLLQWTGGPVLSRLTIYGKNGISETITHEYFLCFENDPLQPTSRSHSLRWALTNWPPSRYVYYSFLDSVASLAPTHLKLVGWYKLQIFTQPCHCWSQEAIWSKICLLKFRLMRPYDPNMS